MGSEVTSKDFCSICVTSTTASINANETEPLLGRQPAHGVINLLCIIALFLFLIAGIAIGTYLLLIEDEDYRVDEGKYRVNTDWKSSSKMEGKLKMRLPIKEIILSVIECARNDCLDVAINLDPAYNFLINENGNIYEDLGWDYQSFGGDRVLCLGLLGWQGDKQARAKTIGALLKSAIDKNVLRPCFAIEIKAKRDRVEVILDTIEELQKCDKLR